MTAITSQHNPRLKELRKLHRARERAHSGLFIAEGEDLVAAAHAAGRDAVEGFRAPGAEVGGREFHEVAPDTLAAVSTLGSGTRAIGVYRQSFSPPVGPLCVYLHGVSDPGNVGAILRSALAFGASCVALGPGCADPHSPKAVRASMGAIFRMALARVTDVGELPGERVALVAHAGEPLADAAAGISRDARAPRRVSTDHGARTEDCAPNEDRASGAAGESGAAVGRNRGSSVTLLVGAEREGLPPEIVSACERVAHIPIASESLNAAMAATVALYETTRRSTRVPTS